MALIQISAFDACLTVCSKQKYAYKMASSDVRICYGGGGGAVVAETKRDPVY